MQSIALVIHVILAVGVIGLVLMQHGKGADAGAAFGSGASATVFGASGSASFLTRVTTGLAVAFFITSLFLFYLAAHRDGSVRSVTDVPGLIDEAPAVPSVTDLPGGVDASDEASGSGNTGDSDLPAPVASESDLPATVDTESDLPAPAE